MVARSVGHDDAARWTLDGHGDSRYGEAFTEASTVSHPSVTPWIVTAVIVVGSVWWSDVLVDPSGNLDRRRLVPIAVIALTVLGCLRVPRRRWAIIAVVLAIVGCWRGVSEWSVASRHVSGPLRGVVRVVEDPEWRGRALRVVIDDGTDRLEAFTYGSTARRLTRVTAGQLIGIEGVRTSIGESDRRRLLLRHVTGRAEIVRVDVRPTGVEASGRGFERSANRMRAWLVRGARVVPEADRALLLGLLIGDDRAQDRETVASFRDSGLAHLTAVSGQNVAFVLAVVSPLFGRFPRGARVAATLALLGWFAILTRAEPSVVRAVVMAGVTTVGSALEWRRRGVDVLAVAVVIGVLVDPFLVWSIGWWLSISGCLGLAVVAPRLETALGAGRLARIVAPTLGAQLGVLLVSVTVFGWPSAWSIPCNLVAGPLAGAVMLIGLPCTLVAAHVPDTIASILMAPIAGLVRTVAVVARLGSAVRPSPWIDASVALGVPLVVIGLSWRRTRVASSRHERPLGPRLR